MTILRLTVVLIGVTTASTASAAISDQEFARCAAIDGDLERLECFDNLSRAKNLDGPQTQPTDIVGKGKWQVDIKTNPIDDTTTVYLILKADSGSSRWGNPVTLVARCQSSKTDLYINWQDYLGSEVSVLTRVGNSPAKTSRWSMSTDKKASFHSQPIAFLKEMLTTNKLVAQVTPYNESPVTAVFDISGLANAIKPMRETCNW